MSDPVSTKEALEATHRALLLEELDERLTTRQLRELVAQLRRLELEKQQEAR